MNIENEIAQTIDNAFTYLKNQDKENIKRYFEYNTLISGLDDMILEGNNSELEQELFKNISWTIENIEFKGNEAVVIVEMSNKNFKEILTEWMKELINEKSNGYAITNDLILKKLKEITEQEKSTKSVIKKVILEKKENSWKINVNDDFINLIYPGIDSVAEVLN